MVTVGELVNFLKQQSCLGEVHCQSNSSMQLATQLEAINTLDNAHPNSLLCMFSPQYLSRVEQLEVGAIICPKKAQLSSPSVLIEVDDPYLAYAYASSLFSPHQKRQGIAQNACVDPTADIASDAYVGPFAVVEAGANVQAGAHVGAHCFIGQDSIIGNNSYLHPRVCIYSDVHLGQSCVIHSGAVIGSDGFGFAPRRSDTFLWQKIEQLGGVRIGDRVEIGANTTIDRGAIDHTQIGSGVIIDNQVQIAHNVKIGDNCALAGCVGIAGSSVLGRNCRLAGGVGLAGHLTLADNVTITGMSMVTKSITEAGSYSCGTPLQPSSLWRKNAARFARLDTTLRKFLKQQQSS